MIVALLNISTYTLSDIYSGFSVSVLPLSIRLGGVTCLYFVLVPGWEGFNRYPTSDDCVRLKFSRISDWSGRLTAASES